MLPTIILATLATAAAAQTPAPTPAVPIPAPAVIVLPTPAPTATPEPTPARTPSAIPAPAPAVTPIPAATPTPRPSPSPSPTPAPEPSTTPSSAPSPASEPVTTVSPAGTPAATPTKTPVTRPPAPRVEGGGWEPWLAGSGAAVLLLLLWLRYQRDAPAEAADVEPKYAAVAAPPPPRPGVPGPWLTVTLRPVRAGLNMITAVADCEITVANGGDAPADAIRAALVLIAAHGGQSDQIDAANAEPIARPVVPAFTLAPGESRTFRSVAAAPLDTLPTMRAGGRAGGREMLVPLVVLNLQHRDARRVEHRTSQSFVLGVERVDSSKLAPFWLDSVRMIDQVAARSSGATLRRRLKADEAKPVGYIS